MNEFKWYFIVVVVWYVNLFISITSLVNIKENNILWNVFLYQIISMETHMCMLLILISIHTQRKIFFPLFCEPLIDVCLPNSIQSSHKTSLTTRKSLVLYPSSTSTPQKHTLGSRFFFRFTFFCFDFCFASCFCFQSFSLIMEVNRME